jgi:hypothetical protein
MTDTSLAGLRAAIDHAGYYPELVADAVDAAVAGEQIEAFVVHQETTFDSEEVRRHITVLALTPGRLVLSHADDHPADSVTPAPYVTTSTEAVPLSSIRSVVVNRVVTDPTRYNGGHPPQEVTVTIGWGAVSRLDLEPATCGDPEWIHRHGLRRRHRAAGQRGRRGRRRGDPDARVRHRPLAGDGALTPA